jgi:hypothetical protein
MQKEKKNRINPEEKKRKKKERKKRENLHTHFGRDVDVLDHQPGFHG